MRIAIGSDHAGYELKETLKAFLAGEHEEVLDVGTHGPEAVDYVDYAAAVGTALCDRRAERGIILCGSGVGASMAANRIPGIRAGLCHDTYSAHQGVEHDDMNVLVLGGRVVGSELARELVDAFLNARFTGEARHVRRVAKMTALENPLRALAVLGQSVWLDSVRRSLMTSGELQRMIDEDRVSGVTSNPAIFEKAIVGSSDYADILEGPDAATTDAIALYERLAVRDIQEAADVLRPVYDDTGGRDGYVSLEVSPLLAADAAGTLAEARRLWAAVGRANLMIKVPGTPEGSAALAQLIAEGINVNLTLLFARDAYARGAEAYLAGLEALVARGGDPSRVASVASFFVSRIDTAVDAALDARLSNSGDARAQRVLQALRGKVAIANAKLAFERYQEIFSGPRWRALAERGAQTQRLLWASTGAKNPRYRDVVYVEELIAADTVNTMPPQTLAAFRDHGRLRVSLTEDLEGARDTMRMLAEAGISLNDTTDRLLAEGIKVFVDAFRTLLAAVERQRPAV
jgi:transaldolase / glucose-6-phosphate isomerase